MARALVKNISQQAAPSGSFKFFAGAAAPSGWLICNGAAVLIADYPQLYAVIGTTFNTQIDPTTNSAWAAPAAGSFRLPDFRGLFIRGVGSPSGGTVVTLGGFQDDQFQSHKHDQNFRTGGTEFGGNRGDIIVNKWATDGSLAALIGAPLTDGAVGTMRTGSETRPKNKGAHYIIKI